MTIDRATPPQLEVLSEILKRGPWRSQAEMMDNFIKVHPKEFRILYACDAAAIIVKANKFRRERGLNEIWPDDEKAEGVCVSLWANEDDDVECCDKAEEAPEDEPTSFDLFSDTSTSIKRVTKPLPSRVEWTLSDDMETPSFFEEVSINHIITKQTDEFGDVSPFEDRSPEAAHNHNTGKTDEGEDDIPL